MSTPEGTIKRKLRAFIDKAGGFWSNIYQDGIHGKTGDPDIVMCYKGRYVALECKSSDGRLTEDQKRRKKQILKAGGIFISPRSVEDLKKCMKEIDEMIENDDDGRHKEQS